MKKLIRQLASESAIYGLSGILTKLINVFLVPLYTRILLPSDYGVLNLINTTFYFVGIFVVFALDNSVARWFFDNEDEKERKKPVASWFWFQFAVAVFVAIIFILLSSPLSKLIVNKDLSQLFIIPSITIISSILPTIIWNWLRLQRKPWLTVGLSTASILLTITLNVVFTIVLKMGIKGILLAALVSNSVYSLVAIALMKDWLNWKYFSLDVLKKMLIYALPLLPTSLAFWILNSSSAYFLNAYWTKDEVGLYSIGSSIASAVSIVIGAFQMAWGPFAFSIMNKPEAKRVYSTVLTLYTLVATFTALTVALFSKEVLLIFTTSKYYPAYLVSGILSFNAIIYGFAYVGSIGSSIAKKTSPVAIAVLLGSVLTVVSYFLLVPHLGKEGAAISTLIGYTIIPIYVFYRSQKLWQIPYKFFPAIIILCAALGLFILNSVLPVYSMGYAIFIKLVLLFSFLVVALVTVYFNYKKEFNNLLQTRRFKFQFIK